VLYRVGRASASVPVCYDRRERYAFLSRYERSKFATQQVDFRARDETGRNDYKISSYGALLCTRGRGECNGRGVL